MTKIHKNLDNDELHGPKDFVGAAVSTVMSKDANGVLEWVPKDDVGGSEGPAGPAGTISAQQERVLFDNASTGLLIGGVVSINVDPTKIDITAAKGQIVDNSTDPENPVIIDIEYAGVTGLPIVDIGTTIVTFLWINSSGTLLQLKTVPTPEDFRDKIFLGNAVHPDFTDVTSVSAGISHTVISPSLNVTDLFNAIGLINLSGNVYSPNGANLNLDRSAGTIYGLGINYKANKKDPSSVSLSAAPALQFFSTWRDGAGGFKTAGPQVSITPGRYDDGTGGASQPNGTVSNNNFSISRLYVSVDGIAILQYGQAIYSSMSEALGALAVETFEENPLVGVTLFRAWVVVKGDASELNDPIDAQFVPADKFGSGAAGGGTSAITTLQQAYDNGGEPEIVTNDIRGPVNIRDGSTDEKDISVWEDVGDNIVAKVDANGNILSRNIRTVLAPIAGVITVDFKTSDEVRPVTITENSTIVISNPIIGKVVLLEVQGDFTLGFPASVKVLNGEYNGTIKNYIFIYCNDSTTPEFLTTISQAI